jgi:hypothetical protein
MEKDEKIKPVFIAAYGLLGFTPEQIEKALGEVAGLQQMAVAREMIKDLAKEELDALSGLLAGSQSGDKQKEIDALMQKHKPSKEFELKAKLAIERILHEHAAYLKTLGNDYQKEKIATLLSEI